MFSNAAHKTVLRQKTMSGLAAADKPSIKQQSLRWELTEGSEEQHNGCDGVDTSHGNLRFPSVGLGCAMMRELANFQGYIPPPHL